MVDIVLRTVKGSPLTLAEVDQNFINLKTAVEAGGGGGGGSGSGWTPLLSIVNDGLRQVLMVVDWFGGSTSKPATGVYVGVSGYVSAIADAVNIKGTDGSAIGGVAGMVAVSAAYSLTQSDNGKVLDVLTAQTITIPTGLSVFSCIIIPPSTGVVTITGATGVTINGVSAGSVTRSASNSAVSIIPTSVANVYKVTGV